MGIAGIKRTQIQGKKYDLPQEEIDIEKWIQKGLKLSAQLEELSDRLNDVKSEIIDIAKKRRDGTTTVTLKGVSGSSTVTFRESYECDEAIEVITHEIGSLFDRFFQKKISFKPTKDLKDFLEGSHDHGLPDAERLKTVISSHVQKKEIKPNVKFAEAG